MHVITQSCVLFIWVHTLNIVTAQDCKLADFLSSDRYDSNFDTSGLAASYAPGAQVRVSCHAGFVGFFKLRCLLDSGWNHIGSKCEAKSCGHPGDADFAEFSLVKGDDFVFGAEVQYTCQSGYQMVSRLSSRRCMVHGWDGVVPVCQAIHCPVIDARNDLQIIGDREEATYGSVLRFSCRSRDLILQGSVEIDCDENGRWSGPAPSCIEVTCTPPRIDNGNVLGNPPAEYKKDETLNFGCERKFKRSHPVPSKCTRVGNRADWIPTPLCETVRCTLTRVPGTSYEPDASRLFSPDDTVTVTCARGYFIGSHSEDTKVITCLDTGEWELSPVCAEITCFNPKLETGVAWTDDWRGQKRKLGNTVSYSCSTGYKATDVSKTATCTRDEWTPKPLCEEIKCEKPDIPNAEIENPQKMEYKSNERVRYRCLKERHTREAYCDRDGWRGIERCAGVTCTLTRPTVRGTRYEPAKGSFSPADTVTVTCASGYSIGSEGTKVITCLDTGEWELSPVCAVITTCNPEVEHGFGFPDTNPTKMFYTCNANYKRFYKGWWGNTTCNDGVWREPPRCIGKKKCGEIPQILHAKITYPQNYNYKPNDQIPFACDKGYHSPDISVITCKNGEWDLNDTTTICKPVENRCRPPPKVKDAIVMSDYQKEYLSETEVIYKCRLEKKPEGKDNIKCKNGEWDWEPNQFNCIAKSCPRPELAAGDITILPDNNGRRIPVDQNLTFSCDTRGKKLNGTSVLTCGEDEKWNHPIPSCEDVTCLQPTADGKIIFQYLLVPDGPILSILTFSCSAPKRLNGISELRCNENGQWNNVFPSCDVPCNVPQLPANLTIKNQPQTSLLWKGDELQFRCSRRLYLQGSEQIECLANGIWSDKVPICSESNSCGAPPHLDDGDLKNSQKNEYSYGESVEYVCQSSYRIEGGSRTCQNGQWVGDVKCLKPCTVNAEDMNRNNIRFKHGNPDDKLHAPHDTSLSFLCQFHDQTSIINLRQKCTDGTITLPVCSRPTRN